MQRPGAPKYWQQGCRAPGVSRAMPSVCWLSRYEHLHEQGYLVRQEVAVTNEAGSECNLQVFVLCQSNVICPHIMKGRPAEHQ